MKFVADENFPRAALKALRDAGCDILAIAEERAGASDETVAALAAETGRILLTFDKDFGELVFRRGLGGDCGVVLFRMMPQSPDEAVRLAVTVLDAGIALAGRFCVVTRERIRSRPMR